jgi:hypothetical protein
VLIQVPQPIPKSWYPEKQSPPIQHFPELIIFSLLCLLLADRIFHEYHHSL